MAVDNILARLRGDQTPVRQLLAPELIVRKSSGAVMPDAEDNSRFNPQQDDTSNRSAKIAASA
jgi:hypothetical protein